MNVPRAAPLLTEALFSTAENATAMRDAIGWIKSLGVDLRNTRFGRYLTELDRYAADVQDGRPPQNTRLFFASSADGSVLLEAYRRLRGTYDRYVINRIRKASSGTDTAGDETEHNSAGRNFCFELSSASWLVSCGLELECDDPADVAGRIAGRYLIVECKRPRSTAQVEKRGREAARRLRERLQQPDHPDMVGVVAFDFTPIANPQLKLIRAVNVDSLLLFRLGQMQVQTFANTYARHWRTWDHSDIVAVFNRVALIGSNMQRNATLKHLVFQSMHPLAEPPSTHVRFLSEFSQLAEERGTAMLSRDQERQTQV